MTDVSDRPILIVDSSNLFMRSWAAYPSMNVHGEQMGGCIGYLKTLRRIVSEVQPRRIYVVWESGGSSKRRALYNEYKLGRRPEKLNRFYEDDIPETDDNRKKQLLKLLSMMKSVPVCQLYVPDCEGDDVIAYLCRGQFINDEKVIVSSDKDMYQLLDEKTKNYNLHKKTYVTHKDVLVEYRVNTCNFALAKAMCGDPSDNIPGIKGLGFKTVSKKFPFLGTEVSSTLQDVIDYAAAHRDESVVYGRVYEGSDLLKRNWRLVYLDSTTLSPHQASIVNNQISTCVPKGDRMAFIKHLISDGFGDFDVEGFFYSFNCIENVNQT